MTASFDSNAEANLSTVRSMFAAVGARGSAENAAEKWAAYAACYADGAVIHEAASLPYGGDYSGPAGVAAHAQAYAAAWGPFQDASLQHLQPTFVAQGDQVIVLWLQRALDQATGERFEMPVTSVYRMDDGRVVESRMFHYDAAASRDFLERARVGA